RSKRALVRLEDDLAYRRRELRLGGGVDDDDVVAAREREHVGRRVQRLEAGAEPASQLEQPTVEVEQRAGIAALGGDVAFRVRAERKPRLAGCEAGAGAAVPLHRVAHRITA